MTSSSFKFPMPPETKAAVLALIADSPSSPTVTVAANTTEITLQSPAEVDWGDRMGDLLSPTDPSAPSEQFTRAAAAVADLISASSDDEDDEYAKMFPQTAQRERAESESATLTVSMTPEATREEDKKTPSFNVNAKPFVFNPSASSFTPTFTPSAAVPPLRPRPLALPSPSGAEPMPLGGGGTRDGEAIAGGGD
jgi:hypothetical protein